jgi:hypothetical protein
MGGPHSQTGAPADPSTRLPVSAQPARETNPRTSVPYGMWAVSLTIGVWGALSVLRRRLTHPGAQGGLTRPARRCQRAAQVRDPGRRPRARDREARDVQRESKVPDNRAFLTAIGEANVARGGFCSDDRLALRCAARSRAPRHRARRPKPRLSAPRSLRPLDTETVPTRSRRPTACSASRRDGRPTASPPKPPPASNTRASMTSTRRSRTSAWPRTPCPPPRTSRTPHWPSPFRSTAHPTGPGRAT